MSDLHERWQYLALTAAKDAPNNRRISFLVGWEKRMVLAGVEAVLEDLSRQVETLDSPHRFEVEETGAVVSVPVDRLVWRSGVLALVNGGGSDVD